MIKLNNKIESVDIDDKNEKNGIHHNVEEVCDDHKKGDHYHDIHHIYGDNLEDDVQKSDFSPMVFFKKRQSRNSIFYISSTGIFLALAIVASLIDIGLEMLDLFIPPINGIRVVMRFLDLMVIMLSVPSIGPFFATIVAFLTPFLHAVIHGEIWNPYEPLFDALAYFITVWLLWLFYYVWFRNSPFHRDPNPSLDKFKKWMPAIPFTLICPLVFVCFYIASIYISELQNKLDDESVLFSKFKTQFFINVIIVYFANILRCGFDIVMFCLIEPKLKIINHRYY